MEIVYTKEFKRGLKRMKKRGNNQAHIENVIDLLLDNKALPAKYKDHALIGKYIGFRECHIEPDWLLIYAIYKEKLILTATGTHCDLDLY